MEECGIELIYLNADIIQHVAVSAAALFRGVPPRLSQDSGSRGTSMKHPAKRGTRLCFVACSILSLGRWPAQSC